VLVIEDNVDAAESLREVLEFGGHTVQLANNGGDGIAKSLSFRPDMILCDIGLPGLDGYEVARRLRAEKTLGFCLPCRLDGLRPARGSGEGEGGRFRRAHRQAGQPGEARADSGERAEMIGSLAGRRLSSPACAGDHTPTAHHPRQAALVTIRPRFLRGPFQRFVGPRKIGALDGGSG
jgi:hypothetical protein